MKSRKSASGSQKELVKSLTEVPLAEDCYNPDLAVTDHYQTFSTEILRLALLGIAALGFLFKEVILNETFKGGFDAFVRAKYWFGGGSSCLAFAAALALIHRYVSSDCIAYQVRYLRLKSVRDEIIKLQGSDSETAAERNEDMRGEKKRLKDRLKAATRTLAAAVVALALGVSLISVGLSKTIFSTKAMRGDSGATNAVQAGALTSPLPLGVPVR